MPELPEVETMRRGLVAAVGEAVFAGVSVLDAKVVAGDPAALERGLTGSHVVHYGRRGKVLILTLDTGDALFVHPRMTGKLLAVEHGEELPSHARVVITLDDGRRLVYADSRRFGRLELVPGGAEDEARLLRCIGPDALVCDATRLAEHLSRRRIPVKTFLLDQRVIAGVGNIYASEICYRCGIDPRTPCHSLRPDEVEELAKQVGEVLADGIAHRGTTISDYRTVGGTSGGFQHLLAVYGRGGQPCRREGCPGTVEKISLGGRSTYFCTHCQHRGRPAVSD